MGLVVQLHIIETYGIMIMRALRHRGDGGKLIILRLNALEEYMNDLITWQQRVDKLLASIDNKNTAAKTCQPQRPHWEPRTKADVRADVIGKFLIFLRPYPQYLRLFYYLPNYPARLDDFFLPLRETIEESVKRRHLWQNWAKRWAARCPERNTDSSIVSRGCKQIGLQCRRVWGRYRTLFTNTNNNNTLW